MHLNEINIFPANLGRTCERSPERKEVKRVRKTGKKWKKKKTMKQNATIKLNDARTASFSYAGRTNFGKCNPRRVKFFRSAMKIFANPRRPNSRDSLKCNNFRNCAKLARVERALIENVFREHPVCKRRVNPRSWVCMCRRESV